MHEICNMESLFPLLTKLDCAGKRLDLSKPVVMGILNIAPDSFYDGGRFGTLDARLKQTEQMLKEGASIIDLGAVSTRPGALEVSPDIELERLLPSLQSIRNHFPECILSVDTYRPLIARAVVDHGADMINDIYGGRFEEGMLATISNLKVPYILMHLKGDPEKMQDNPAYSDVVAEVAYFLEQQTIQCRAKGIHQIIIDPGFGFGKTIQHNFQLLSRLETFRSLGFPLMVGISRKSLIHRFLEITPDTALNGTTVLHTIALLKGANILRVHDVKEAMEAIRLVGMLDEQELLSL